jgi:hypothetical protein
MLSGDGSDPREVGGMLRQNGASEVGGPDSGEA